MSFLCNRDFQGISYYTKKAFPAFERTPYFLIAIFKIVPTLFVNTTDFSKLSLRFRSHSGFVRFLLSSVLYLSFSRNNNSTSLSTLSLPAIPNFSTIQYPFGLKCGSVGPAGYSDTSEEAQKTLTAFCSYHAMLYILGRSLMSSSPQIFCFLAMPPGNMYISLPRFQTRGFLQYRQIQLIVAYFAQPAVRLTVSPQAFAKSV